MSEALPLPPRPNLEQYKKLAKDLHRARTSGDPDATAAWLKRWPEPWVLAAWRRFESKNKNAGSPSLADAQLFLARLYGFANWPRFASHLRALAQENSTGARFEAAADAIVAGGKDALAAMLRSTPSLVHERSERDHRSTLLHYVSANGIEDFRQKTPPNIVEIARLLLDAGCDVNAESRAYGGHSTVLALTATSYHPEKAGVQLALLDLLLSRGARLDGPESIVNACLQNGRGEAALFLADRGAPLDLEGAAGAGRADLVPALFDPATERQRERAFGWACEFGRLGVVEFFLQRSPTIVNPVHAPETGLHWAACGGQAGVVELLLQHGASVDIRDARYGSTPLGWALYCWGNRGPGPESARFCRTVACLARAGAAASPEETASAEGDPLMRAALAGVG